MHAEKKMDGWLLFQQGMQVREEAYEKKQVKK